MDRVDCPTLCYGGAAAPIKMPINYKSVINHFSDASEHVQAFFPDFVELVKFTADKTKSNWQVPVSYVYSRLEVAKRNTICLGLVKLHWCDHILTQSIVDKDHFERERFLELFETVYGKPIREGLLRQLQKGEKARDKYAHGTTCKQSEAYAALNSMVDFATGFDEFVKKVTKSKFGAFGTLQGFTGKKEHLSKDTTRWVLKGVGFKIS